MDRIHRDESALYHACGYSCDNAIYLQIGSDRWFVTDGRYKLDAQRYVKGAEVVIGNDLTKKVARLMRSAKPKKIAYDPKEWDVYSFEKLKAKTKVTYKPKPDLSHKERIIKSPREIKLLGKAAKQGARAFESFAKHINTNGFGTSEQQLFMAAEAAMRGETNKTLSFEPIVAIGVNASNPHARPRATSLHKGDLLLFDAGLRHKRYCSDRTRTVQVDRGFGFDIDQKFTSHKIQKAYDTVLQAHDKAIAKARSGMRAQQIDAIARQVIERAGYGKYFVHSTGHGVGLDIHEMPYISAKSRTKIKDGMVYTIEPGIYIPGEFGIRIEDMVVMEEGRARVL